MPHLNHIGLYGNDIEEAKHFFEKCFDAQAGENTIILANRFQVIFCLSMMARHWR